MTVMTDIANRLSDDSQYTDSAFHTSVYTYGKGVMELLADGGYKPGGPNGAAMVEIESALGDAEQYSEGDPLPSPIESTIKEVKFPYYAFRGVIRESGHERRARGGKDQGARVKDAQRKIKRCYAAIENSIAKYFDDAAAYGLEGMISNTGYDYGDHSRTDNAAFRGYELACSTADISVSLANKFVHMASDDPYGCAFDLVVMSATQCWKYATALGGLLQLNSADQRQGANLVMTNLAMGGAPVVMLPNLTTSIVLGLTGAKKREGGEITQPDDGLHWFTLWNEENPGRFHVLDLGADNSDTPMNIHVSTSLNMVCDKPNAQGKMTGLKTT